MNQSNHKYSDFGQLLRKTRKIKYEDIKEFSKKTGIPSNLLYQYELGRAFPSIENLVVICKYLDKTPTYMLSPFLDLNNIEYELLTLCQDIGIKEILKDDEVSRLLKSILLGIDLLYLMKKHLNNNQDVINYLKSLKNKLFEEGQIKKIQ